MELPPFLLDRWIEQKNHANPPVDFDLASSTGPVWKLRELLALADADPMEMLLDTPLSYTSALGSPALREAVASLEGVGPECVQVVTGASEALLILFYLAAEPGANVLLPNPGFPANSSLTSSLGIETRYYALRAENQFRIDPDEIRRQVDRNTRLLLVNSPHNPTGAVLSDAEMDALHDFCADRGIQFVSDQVYHPIYHGIDMRSAARLPHATVISDFSKALCLSGLRLGWMIDHDAARRERYRNARNHFTVTATALGEKLAVLALENSGRIYERARGVARSNLALLDDLFARYHGVVEWVRPNGGMTAFPRLASGDDTREFCVQLMKQGVLIVPGDCFGAPAHFRVGFAASAERFPLGVARLDAFLASWAETKKRAAPAAT